MNKQSGQTLIEVVAALSIASVVLGGLVVVVLNGLRNAKFAQNQALATKYSQDTMEEIRAIRDRNSDIGGSGLSNKFSCYLGAPCIPPTPPNCLVTIPSVCYFSLVDSQLDLADISPNSAPQTLINGFSRLIQLTPVAGGPATEKTIVVTISWVDVSGTHNSVLETNLTSQ